MCGIECVHAGFFYFDPDDPIYMDHFPGHPVVPGSLIIHAFLEAFKKRSGAMASRRIRRFRFKRFISPGRYSFRLEHQRSGACNCLLFDKSELVATGVLKRVNQGAMH